MDKLDKARNIIRRLRDKVLFWEGVARGNAMLVAQERDAAAEANDLSARPLGYTHGLIGRLAQELPECTVSLSLGKALVLIIRSPRGTKSFSFADEDYDVSADLLASRVRRVAEEAGLILKRDTNAQ